VFILIRVATMGHADLVIVCVDGCRIATDSHTPVPSLADLLYTALLASASGQDLMVVANIKGLRALPLGE
jgi:hypothetical protein